MKFRIRETRDNDVKPVFFAERTFLWWWTSCYKYWYGDCGTSPITYNTYQEAEEAIQKYKAYIEGTKFQKITEVS